MRVIIVSPYPITQQSLEYEVSSYFQRELKVKFSEEGGIAVQKFNSIADSGKDKNQAIGAGKEALIIFDRRLCPSERQREHSSRNYDRRKKQASSLALADLRSDLLRESFLLTKRICEQKEIPYILYEGEIEKGLKEDLTKKLVKVKDLVSYRLAGNPFDSSADSS